MSSIRQALARFARASSGTVTTTFAVSAVALFLGAGIAIDSARYYSSEAELQSVVDGALLAAMSARKSRDDLSESEMEQIARDFLKTNLGADIEITALDLVESKTGSSRSIAYGLEVDATYPTTLLRLASVDKMELSVTAQAAVDNNLPVELALVLDNTGSMAGKKLQALKDAATDMVDTVLDGKNSLAKMAIVPFSDYVNVGLKNRGQWWLSVPDDYSTTNYQCSTSKPVVSKSGCKKVTKTGTNDGVPYTYQVEECSKIVYGPEVKTCGNKTTTYKWSGCVGSRNYPLNTQDKDYKSSPVPGLLNTSCTQEILPLTDNAKTLRDKIKTMTATGNTYIPAGLIWGWRVLSSDAPYAEAMPAAAMKSKNGVKALVLMTDGENVKSPTYPKHNGSSKTLANKLMLEVCTNVKAQAIELYTIAFEVNDPVTEDLLKTCSSGKGYYYSAEDSDELAAAFDDIADKLTMLRLTK
jgi:Flp pilus assembly protein TadG